MVQEYSAGGLVYQTTSQGRFWLLVRHNKALHWGFPKGHVADKVEGELFSEAAIREVREEGGVMAEIVHPQAFDTSYWFSQGVKRHRKTVSYYLMKYVSGTTEDHDREVEQAEFVLEAQVPKRLTFDIDRRVFERALMILSERGM